MPIAWQSKHIRRVLKSTLVAETLTMVDISETCLSYRKLLLELLQVKDKTDNIKIICKMNSSCLYESVHLSTQVVGKKLCICCILTPDSWVNTVIAVCTSINNQEISGSSHMVEQKFVGEVQSNQESDWWLCSAQTIWSWYDMNKFIPLV